MNQLSDETKELFRQMHKLPWSITMRQLVEATRNASCRVCMKFSVALGLLDELQRELKAEQKNTAVAKMHADHWQEAWVQSEAEKALLEDKIKELETEGPPKKKRKGSVGREQEEQAELSNSAQEASPLAVGDSASSKLSSNSKNDGILC